MRKIILLIIFIFSFLLAETKGTLTVSGESSSDLRPDVIYLTILIEKDGLTAQEAQEVHKKLVAKVMNVITQSNIEPSRVKTESYALQPIYPEDKKEKAIYRSSILVTVELYQIGELGSLIDALLVAGATKVEKIDYALKDEEAARQEVLKTALRNAKARAGVVAGELNLKLLEPVSINEKTSIKYEADTSRSVLKNSILINAQTDLVYEYAAGEAK